MHYVPDGGGGNNGEPAGQARQENGGQRGRRAPSDEIDLLDGDAPLIPEGPYEAIGGPGTLYPAFRGRKLRVDWNVLVPDAAHPDGRRRVILHRHYNVGKGPQGRFTVRVHSRLAREWTIATGRRMSRRQSFSRNAFQGVLCRVVVRTVTEDRNQRALAPEVQYSVIDRIEARLAGGPGCC